MSMPKEMLWNVQFALTEKEKFQLNYKKAHFDFSFKFVYDLTAQFELNIRWTVLADDLCSESVFEWMYLFI